MTSEEIDAAFQAWLNAPCDFVSAKEWEDKRLKLAFIGGIRAKPEARAASKLPSLPDEIQEWCWHMDLHVTEHDERHAAMALRSAWPHVSKWLQENVGPSSKAGVPFAQSPRASASEEPK